MRDYRQLEVWNLGKRFAVVCYELTYGFPKEELYNLTCQIRRVSVTIAANIAEGVGRNSDTELLYQVRKSLGSINEIETLFSIASDLGFIDEAQLGPFEQMSKDLSAKLLVFSETLDTKVKADREAAMKKVEAQTKLLAQAKATTET